MTTSDPLSSWLRARLELAIGDERGEGIVTFLIVVAGAAVAALAAVGVYKGLIQDKAASINLN